jgi:alcohol dehydrogenase (cytochrome c)
MNRRFELISIMLFALDVGVGGGVTSSRADEAAIEVGVGDLRGEILSLFAPQGAVATEMNPITKAPRRPRLRLLPRRPLRTGRATTRR